jgi:purine-binding chemotaxis protein CheW
VIDLQVRFGRSPAEIGKRSCIVILEISFADRHYQLGIMVDAVSAVVDIGNSQIEPPPRFGTAIAQDFIAGMGKLDEKFIIMLDITKTFTPGELAAMDTTPPAAPLAGTHL